MTEPQTSVARARRTVRPELIALALAATSLLALLLGLALGEREFDVWGGIGIPCLLLALTVPIILTREQRRGDGLGRLLALGLVARFVATYYRFLMEFRYYGFGDALTYHGIGAKTASMVWSGELPVSSLVPSGTSTDFIRNLTGLVEMFTAQSLVGAFMVYSWFAFLGIWAFLNAARRAVPNLNVRRYTLLLIFMPSMLFWSSAIGKDAWMVLWLGVFAAGAARILTRARGGIAIVVVSGVLAGLCRPHVVLLAVAALLITVVFAGGRNPVSRGVGGPRRIVLATLLVVGLTVALGSLTAIFPKAQPLSDPAGLTDLVSSASTKTSAGGSQIETSSPNAVYMYPVAMLSALYRPVLIEARNPPTLIAALEGTLLLGMTWVWRANIMAGLRQLRRTPYLMFATLYGSMFYVVWSSISNLGILARQRVQGLPFLLLLLAIQTRSEQGAQAVEEDAEDLANEPRELGRPTGVPDVPGTR
jgi:hypothetical protein